MVICIIALVTFGILSIFSARYRPLAKEAFHCVFLKLTLRPCNTKLDQRIKSKVTAKLLKKSPKLGKFTYKHFDLISFIFVIIFFASTIYSGIVVYNLYAYGSCDPHSTECVFNPESTTCESDHCAEQGCACEDMGCEAPDYIGCKGNCSCQEQICG